MSELILRRHPFDQDPGTFPVRAGQTLAEMLREGAQGAELSELLEVRIGGEVVPREWWPRVRPREGVAILVTGLVRDGGIVRSVLMIAVAVFAWWAAPWLTGAFGILAGASTTMVATGLYMLGALAVNALVPPPKPPQGGSGPEGRWNMLTGSSNQMNPYGAIPLVLGEARYFPPHAAMPYTQSVGEDSYQYCLFDLGYGDLDVSDIRIGDTPLSNFDGVTFEITTTPSLYTSDVSETVVSAAMEDGEIIERTTAPNVSEISLDIVYTQGLFGIGTSGKEFARHSYWDVKYRPVGSTTWLNPPSPRLSGLSPNGDAQGMYVIFALKKQPFAVGIAFDVPAGQYEVQVRRRATPTGGSGNTYIHTAAWSVLRSIRRTLPSTTGTTKLAMRIKANDQLNGTLQTLSCLVRQRIPVWNRDLDTWSNEFTCNTAWVYHWLLSACPGVAVHVPTGRINLEQIAGYADFCNEHMLQTRRVVDNRLTMRDLLQDVLAGSLATIGQTNGQYGVVFDSGDGTPTMAFTELEVGQMRVQRVFSRLPHGLRVRFQNPEADWAVDELVVLDDGYSYRGVDARGRESNLPEATRFETLDLQIACYAQQAWRLARAHFAQAKFRPNTYSFQTDIAALGCTRGDVVCVQDQATEWGAGAGRVVATEPHPDGGMMVILDGEIETDLEKTYRAQVRRVSGDSLSVTQVYDVKPTSPRTTAFWFPGELVISVDDVVIIGEAGKETAKLIITGITPMPDLSFGVAAVAFDPRVAPYWASPPDLIVSEITGAPIEPPDAPAIDVVISNIENSSRDDAGINLPSIHVMFGRESGFAQLEAR